MIDNDDIEVYLDQTSDGSSYLESLVRSRMHLAKLPGMQGCAMIKKLEQVIDLELDLAIMGAEKAKSEIIKKAAKEKDNLRPIK